MKQIAAPQQRSGRRGMQSFQTACPVAIQPEYTSPGHRLPFWDGASIPGPMAIASHFCKDAAVHSMDCSA